MDRKKAGKAIGLGQASIGIMVQVGNFFQFKFRPNNGDWVGPTESQPSPILHDKGKGKTGVLSVFRFGNFASSNDHGDFTRGVGGILKRESHPNHKHDDQHDQEGSNIHYGLVQLGTHESLAKSVPIDQGE